MTMSIDELVAVYLVQHPEDEPCFFDEIVLGNGQRARGPRTVAAALRYAQWCYDNGYIDRAAYVRTRQRWGPTP
jgi:hypothetical protein